MVSSLPAHHLLELLNMELIDRGSGVKLHNVLVRQSKGNNKQKEKRSNVKRQKPC
jgi:hypothetical protein